ncbi:hypothetical protein GQF56_21555 [Rhodobacter sphaeroides]|mgnify:CR=1 FL=1|jgi:hypothetical protein|uniref:Uncharacterized protein n=2 Tax=Cereibacter sphaeroides TaxID=1063 RepID=Q3IV88_CERS4|nr:hypothetical protein [Cereibacter sphaeroides]ABA81546.1 hypothetical protein RSP_4068 [Cereibacter sphaeroides 2.4.1]AXC64063.1 hypothetical protein DQL45_22045 [Cereibacter sphaeroides 2.4.1]MVX50412.1 hypothetical protein [Cereibacter sphaeroides]QHA15477.1 hypothetical protein GQY06_21805 [Cereibacter sphaeroides]GEM94632.1 hypothetical protein RSP03_36990 [Cereibacter sphaeroides]
MFVPRLTLKWMGLAGSLVKGAAGLAAAGSLFLAAVEYADQGKAARAAETIRLIDRWEETTSGVLTAYRSLGQRLTLALAERTPALDGTRPPEELAALLVADVLQQEGAADEFERIVYFFTRLELCIEATLCDEHTAAIFFSDTVDTFMKNFRSAVLERRRSDPHFGSEIRKLQIRLNRSAAGQDAFDPDRPLP